MEENFNLLFSRVVDTLEKSDLVKIKEQLESIKGNSVIVAQGGSSVVGTFMGKVLNIPNVVSVRDLNYMNLNDIDNIIIVSYSGLGTVVANSLVIPKKKYLFTNNDTCLIDAFGNNVEIIKYDNSIPKERSFISLASTLMPICILYQYMTGLRYPCVIENISDMFSRAKDVNIHHNDVYEIMSGYDYSTSSKYLETTMTEAGIAIPIVHDKYDYCHGRFNLSYFNNHGLIYFDSDKELDKLLLSELKNYYTEIVRVEKYYPNDVLENDLYGIIKSMFITYKLASNKNMDLSNVDYSPVAKKLYKYHGGM